jgi:hypothetical protein
MTEDTGRMTSGMDEIMGEDDLEMVEALVKARKAVMAYFDRDVLITRLKAIVNESEVVNFASARVEKFIDPRRPILKLRIERCEKLNEVYGAPPPVSGEPSDGEKDAMAHYMLVVLHGEVSTKLMDFILDALYGTLGGREKVREALPEGIPYDLLQKFVISTMFGMRANINAMTADFEYYAT